VRGKIGAAEAGHRPCKTGEGGFLSIYFPQVAVVVAEEKRAFFVFKRSGQPASRQQSVLISYSIATVDQLTICSTDSELSVEG
jgi:hypothetical protein